ncbi:MAG: hypothetical protein JWO60_2004 [Frankiales bacterium]|nr:hypothetical protein [Frankiales bacterium]
MSLPRRRRLAAGGGLLSAALVAGLVVTAGPARAEATPDKPSVLNSATERLTFTTTASVPIGSSAFFEGPVTSVPAVVTGARSASFTSDVDMNNDVMQKKPSVSVDFSNPDPASASAPGPGPADPGAYRVEFRSVALGPLGGTRTDGCDSCLRVLTSTPPTVTDSSGAAAEAGGRRLLTLRGTGFARSTLVEVLKADGTSDVDVSAAGAKGQTTTTTLTRTFSPRTGAGVGPRDLRLTNTDGQTTVCAGCFTVLGPLLSSTPRETTNSSPVDFTFTGAAGSFTAASRPVLQYTAANVGSSTRDALSIVGTNVRPSADGSSLVVTFDLTGAAPGIDAYRPTVTTGSVTSVTDQPFTVTQPDAPTVSGVAPATGEAGKQQTLQVAGTGFAKGAVVVFEQSGGTPLTPTTTTVRASSVEYRSPSVLIATVTFPSTASGAYAVRVMNTDGKEGTRPSAFTVTPAASPSPSATTSGSPSPSASASRTPSASPTVTTTPTRSATPAASASRSATPTASATPTPARPTVSLDRSTITSQQKAVVRGTARPGSRVQLRAYSRPSTTYVTVRETTVGPDGAVVFEVGPSGNTRLFLRQLASASSPQLDSDSTVLTVRTSINLKVVRTAAKTYRFTGSTLPKRRGQLVTVFYQPAGGNRVIASRARVSETGTYNVTRRFSGGGNVTLFTATGTDINNAGNESNRVRTTLR